MVWLKDLVKFIGKYLCWSLYFNEVTALRPVTLLKRDSNTGVFLVNFAFTEHLCKTKKYY